MYRPNKRSLGYNAIHAQDNYTDLGFDYRGKILKKTISKTIFNNKNNKAILEKVDEMLVFLVDRVKQIKLHYMFSLDKNDRNLN